MKPEVEKIAQLSLALTKAIQALEVAAEALESAGNYPNTLDLVNTAIEEANASL